MLHISSISALQIFDSRGKPTVECELRLSDGSVGRGLVPSGASRGQFEALELRDEDPKKLGGQSVFKAIANIHDRLAPRLSGLRLESLEDLAHLDRTMMDLDGTANKSHLGANAILAVSLAAADAAAKANHQPLYEWLGRGEGHLLPLPEIQIVGGGAHAHWRTDIQDFLLIAIGARTYAETLEITSNTFHKAGAMLRARGHVNGVADEGGHWPAFATHEEVLTFLTEAITGAGYVPGVDAAIALDIAASDLFDHSTGRYTLKLDKAEYDSQGFAQLIASWCERFAIVSVEDPLADTDTAGWSYLRTLLQPTVQLIGDDLFTTNPARIRAGIEQHLANAVLIKPNQIGTVTETLEAIALTQAAGWLPVVSARSGETEDAFIAHLAVATNAGQLKVGSFSRSERMVKWNEVLRIERSLGPLARFEGANIYNRLL
jgi:enolase